jgi:hypothetical protein
MVYHIQDNHTNLIPMVYHIQDNHTNHYTIGLLHGSLQKVSVVLIVGFGLGLFQLYRSSQFYWWRKHEYPEKPINLLQVTD